MIPLDEVRADGWFEGLAASAPSFHQLCDVLGERFVAFSIIADVRVVAVTVDPTNPGASLVDFHIGDSERQHRLPLAEFRRRVAAALLADAPPHAQEEPPSDVEGLRAFIGVVPVLLAPIFGMRLVSLQVGGGGAPTVVVEVGGERNELDLDALRERVRGHVRQEVQRVEPAEARASFDLAQVEQAEQANARGDWEQTVRLLGSWPGPLSMFMRTPEARRLGADEQAGLARGLGLLGTAYAELQHFDWAEEVLRLGIQWSQDGPVAGDLFRRLGTAYLAQGREGEAIGLLRRALALGVRAPLVLPALARSYVARGRYVAAAACLDEAVAAGAEAGALAPIQAAVEARLGAAWSRFRDLVPARDARSTTAPPPRDG